MENIKQNANKKRDIGYLLKFLLEFEYQLTVKAKWFVFKCVMSPAIHILVNGSTRMNEYRYFMYIGKTCQTFIYFEYIGQKRHYNYQGHSPGSVTERHTFNQLKWNNLAYENVQLFVSFNVRQQYK